METVVLTSPSLNLSLEGDIRLIKIALLYSDHVSLVSPTSTLVQLVTGMATLDDAQLLEVAIAIVPTISPELDPAQTAQLLTHISKLKNKRGKSKQELVMLGKLQSTVRSSRIALEKAAKEAIKMSNVNVLMPLIESGILTIEPLQFGSGEDGIKKMFIDAVADALKQSATHYPLFDSLMGDIARHYAAEQGLSLALTNPREIAFGKDVILEVGNIDAISIADIQRLKLELDEELDRFQGLLLDYSRQLQAPLYTEESAQEMRRQYVTHIKPELADLRRQLSQNRFYKHLVDEVMSNTAGFKATLSLVACSLFEMNNLLAALLLGIDTSYKAAKTVDDRNEAIKKHPLFFLNELSK